MPERPPLELTVYPLCEDDGCATPGAEPHYAEPLGVFTWYADERTMDKRLTVPELAAEYWKHVSGLYDGHGKQSFARRNSLYRFATLPHAAENGYE